MACSWSDHLSGQLLYRYRDLHQWCLYNNQRLGLRRERYYCSSGRPTICERHTNGIGVHWEQQRRSDIAHIHRNRWRTHNICTVSSH